MLEAVDPVDHEIVPDHEQHGRDEHPGPAVVVDIRVKQALAADLGQEKGHRQDVDEGDRLHGRYDLLADLVFEEARVVLEAAVEDAVVGQGAKHPVEAACTDLGDDHDGDDLAHDVVARPCRAIAMGCGCSGQVGAEAGQPLGGVWCCAIDVCGPRGNKVGVGLVKDQRVENVEGGVHGGRRL